MVNDGLVPVKEAILKLQLCLFNGIHDEGKLFAAGSLMSQSDYQDVVTERSIASMCGYPLCNNALPSERLGRKGRYRILLKEHKVYDLHETFMYCSTSCGVNSRAFAGSLQEERCSVLHPSKLDEVLRLFKEMSVINSKEDELGRNGDLGLSELKIQEKEDIKIGEVSMEEWIGPPNAIEGYVPQRDYNTKASHSKNRKEVSKPRYIEPDKEKDMMFNEFDFTSTIITQDEYSISKLHLPLMENGSSSKVKYSKRKVSCKEIDNQFTAVDTPYDQSPSSSKINLEELNEEKIVINMNDKLHIAEVSNSLSECQSCPSVDATEVEKGSYAGKAAQSNASVLRPSLKSSSSKKVTRSITLADEKTTGNRSLCKISELEDTAKGFSHSNLKEDDNSLQLASAEACALALSQVAEAVASEVCDVPDAVSEAGIILLSQPPNVVEEDPEEEMDMDIEPPLIKWPRKQRISHSDFFYSEDSWYDNPPEGFSLNLSPFATMLMALFAWISSSSLAYIYGQDESFHEEYLTVNGRECPRKIVYTDGRSSEIK